MDDMLNYRNEEGIIMGETGKKNRACTFADADTNCRFALTIQGQELILLYAPIFSLYSICGKGATSLRKL